MQYISDYKSKLNSYLVFNLNNSKYAINSTQVLEIIKLPALIPTQNKYGCTIGYLKYNQFLINIIDLRYFFKTDIIEYSLDNEIIIIKTDESIFGIVADKTNNLVNLEKWNKVIFT